MTRDWVELSIAVDDSVVVLGVAVGLDAVLGIGLGVGPFVAIGAGRGVGDGVGGVGRGVGGNGVGRGVGRGVGLGVTQASHVHMSSAVVQSRQLLSSVTLRCKMLQLRSATVSAEQDRQRTKEAP